MRKIQALKYLYLLKMEIYKSSDLLPSVKVRFLNIYKITITETLKLLDNFCGNMFAL